MATPILLIGAAMVGFAVWFGDVPILQVAGGVAVLTGIAAVVVFDRELVQTRREHGAERARLAKEYVEMYAARLRERLHANAVPVPPLPEESALAATAATAEAEPQAASTSETDAESEPTTAVEPKAEPAPVAAVASTESAEEMWDSQDAPTVVDLIAYEVRARIAEDERKEAEAARAAEQTDADQVAAASGA